MSMAQNFENQHVSKPLDRFDTHLSDTKNEGKVASDSLLFKDFRSLNSLPSGSNLDQDAIFGDADFLVKFDDVACLVDGGLGIKGETSINFSGDVARDDFGDFGAKSNSQFVLNGIGRVKIDNSANYKVRA